MVDLSGSVYLVYIGSAAILALLGIVGHIRNLQLVTLASARKKTLYSIATCSFEFRPFYRFLNSPDDQVTLTGWGMRIEYYFLIFIPIVVPAAIFVYNANYTYSNPVTLLYATAITIIAYPIFGAILRYLTLRYLAREARDVRPSNRLTIYYSYLKFLNLLVMILFLAYLVGPAKQFDGFITTTNVIDIEATSLVLAIILGPLVVFFFLFRSAINRFIRDLDDGFYRTFFSRQAPNLEVVVRDDAGRELQTVQGKLVGVGRVLLLRRDDGFVSEIEWRNIRRVSASPQPKRILAIQ